MLELIITDYSFNHLMFVSCEMVMVTIDGQNDTSGLCLLTSPDHRADEHAGRLEGRMVANSFAMIHLAVAGQPYSFTL